MGISIFNLEVGHEGLNGWETRPDSTGGVGVKFNFRNTGTKTIKYATFGFIPYNAVGDAVSCSITGKSENLVLYTGPLEPNQIPGIWGKQFDNAWYNPSVTSVKVSKVIVEYMDGTKEIIDGADVPVQLLKSGCYVATAVYGSYDCPQVWTLRRYRDNTLAETWYGRAFIRTYYAISPTMVKWFGDTTWFKKLWKPKLDRMVKKLNSDGVENTPYQDRNW